MSNISFFSTEEIHCPVCETIFFREIVRQGGGRFIAENMSVDLYRNYKETKKYGKVFPILYQVITCPKCFFSVLGIKDFENITSSQVELLKLSVGNKVKKSEAIFNTSFDFNEPKTLIGGAIAYFYALSTYSHLSPDSVPTLKKAICAIRISWLIREVFLEQEKNKTVILDNAEDIYWQFRILARKLYIKTHENFLSGKEILDKVDRFGPDIDVDYGYNGFVYVLGCLVYEQRDLLDPQEKNKLFTSIKIELSRSFGIGEGSREKPSVLLEKVKGLVISMSRDLKNKKL